MNRRNLLKGAGSLALGLPAATASGLTRSAVFQPSGKDLIVTLAGPFCYWLQEKNVKVMAPPVGTDRKLVKHQGWVGTSANEVKLNSKSVPKPPEYALTGVPESSLPQPSGTPTYGYEQGTPLGVPPLFNFIMPFPHGIVGTRPSYVDIEESGKSQASQGQLLAAGLTFYYKNVDLSNVWITRNNEKWFQACFINDKDLPCASLGIHLSPVDQSPDHGHVRAMHVWKKMLSMYPWMKKDVHGITFLAFDSSRCPPKPPLPGQSNAGQPEFGPGNDCEVPIMTLPALGQGVRGRK